LLVGGGSDRGGDGAQRISSGAGISGVGADITVEKK